MHLRSRPPAVLALVLLLAGCSSVPLIEVPEGAGATAVITPTAVATAGAAAPQSELDCAAVLPEARIEESAGLPAGSVTLVDDGRSCSYGAAGNPSALVITVGPARLLETFVGAGEAVGATAVPLGEAAYRLEPTGDASQPRELAILAGGHEVRIVSYLGDSSTAVDWASAALSAVGVRL